MFYPTLTAVLRPVSRQSLLDPLITVASLYRLSVSPFFLLTETIRSLALAVDYLPSDTNVLTNQNVVI